MNGASNSILVDAVMKILRPLARVLLRNGVACGSLEELVRKAYVDEAFRMASRNHGKVTVSAVSAQTGLSRKEVKRLKETESLEDGALEQKYNRAIRVISGWVNDPDYLDEDGKSKTLEIDGEQASFASLVKKYSGDVTTVAMLERLDSAGCIKLLNNSVMLIKHAYVPGEDSAEIVRIFGADTNELMSTIDHNLVCNDNDKRFQRKVSTSVLDKKAVNEFVNLSNQRSQALLEELDAWIAQHETTADDENACYVSVGVYYFERMNAGD